MSLFFKVLRKTVVRLKDKHLRVRIKLYQGRKNIPYKLKRAKMMMKLLKKSFRKRRAVTSKKNQDNYSGEIKLPRDLAKKMQMLRPYIEKNSDIISRPFFITEAENLQAVAIYMEGMVDTAALNRDILKPLMLNASREQLEKKGTKHLIDRIYQTSLTVGRVLKVDTFPALVQIIFDGLTILMFDGLAEVLAVDIRAGENRAIEEPTAEKTLRGPREGFIESLVVNIALIRRKLRDPNLVVEKMVLGKRTRTEVAFLYIDDIADPQIVAEVKARVAKIDIDGNVVTGYIEQLIEDNPYSVFPQIQGTERPDKVMAQLLEGKIALLADGSPFVSILPSLFVQFLQASEDYFDRTYIGSFLRAIRYIAFFLAISLPAIYVALLSFQQELIPFDLIVSLAENRKAVPFPVAVEALLLELIIQMTIETGLRLPTPLGSTVGVVGGIILGQAAISANLASPAIVIIISVTTICTFAIPVQSMALATRILRLPLLVFAASFGVFGFSLGWLLILAHLASLESVGVPYFAPFAPTRFADLKDSFFRTFIYKMKNRPVSIPVQDRQRQASTGRKDKNNGR